MAKIRSIKDKISSIEKIKKITNAMQIVALTRLRKMEHETLDARGYFDKIRELLLGIHQNTNFNMHPLLEERQSKAPAVAIVLGSDKGLCGNFNHNVLNKVSQLQSESADGPLRVVVCGRKIIKALNHKSEYSVVDSYAPIAFDTLPQAVNRISSVLINEFLRGHINSLFLIYNEFKRHIMGEAKAVTLLPLMFETPKEIPHTRNYVYEPRPREVLDELLKEYVNNQIHHALLETRTAEEMARMLSMKTATDNANEVIKKLALMYHKARQAQITGELMDIVGAAEGVA